ncbi:tRNA-splicing endonuclease subunit sen34 [Akanthomyces lecanii RCEF 1005]|uniref:tRNA-splicing endonuclease subunit Sen34 n=1 Tax=Akanthomyces lecanii RCEF 1005 TaxID=1081108 RepID=A0A168C2R3_CORDF|nr:tRNA-splicing endonuclease subunit sen34 [Akanthomyces lecanii RCEF 1005]
MAALEAPFPVRIARIAGRYLVFDTEAAALLRRQVNTNGVLVGTAPQQPTQNIFLGLPIELRPEEVEALVRKGAAYVVDGAAAHRDTLQSYRDPALRRAYIESLRKQKEIAQAALAERSAQRAAEVADKLKRGKNKKGAAAAAAAAAVAVTATDSPDKADGGVSQVKTIGVTPTSSTDLVPASALAEHRRADELSLHEAAPLCRHLLDNGYHMTPGLRFGAQYSVYPGDPLRFHAHFMASQYDWDEPIPILDIVAGGRLATAVKKAFLLGGEQPAAATTEGQSESKAHVRTFCLEWAAM